MIPPRPGYLPEKAGVDKRNNKKRNLLIALGAGGAAIALGAGTVLGINMNKNSEETPGGTDPVATGEASPGAVPEETKQTDLEATPTERKLSFSELDTPEKLVNAQYSIINEWRNDKRGIKDCAEAILYDDSPDSVSYNEMIANSGCSAAVNKEYSEALYGASWEDNPRVADMVRSQQDAYNGSIAPMFFTDGESPQYESRYDITDFKVLNTSDEEMTIQSRFVGEDNFESTSLGSLDNWSGYGRIQDTTGGVKTTFTRNGDSWVISSEEYSAR